MCVEQSSTIHLVLRSLGYSLEQSPKVLMTRIAIDLYLTLDQQVVFSVARITGVANLPLRMWSSSKKHQLLLTWAPGLGAEPGSRGQEAHALPLSYPHTLNSPFVG